MLTVAVLTQTLSRFWRWRECAFRGRAVTWKEAAKALAADEMWVRGSTEQKVLAEPGLSGSVGGGCRKKMRCFYMATSLLWCKKRGEFSSGIWTSWAVPGERSQVQLVSGLFWPKTAVWELSVLPPANVLGGLSFPCHLTAACGYWQCMLLWEDAV